MLIGKNWKIESDELNVTLYERITKKKDGKEYWKPHSYYSSVSNCLKSLVNIQVNKTGLKDLETVKKEIEGLHQLIESLKV